MGEWYMIWVIFRGIYFFLLLYEHLYGNMWKTLHVELFVCSLLIIYHIYLIVFISAGMLKIKKSSLSMRVKAKNEATAQLDPSIHTNTHEHKHYSVQVWLALTNVLM